MAASLKAWNRRDCYPRQAILDSGASDHFLPMRYKGNCEKKVTDGIIVTCANGGQLVSTATDVINYQGLPPAAIPCHKFPNRQLVDPLLSLGKLATHGCCIAFVGDKVTVTNPQGTVVLIRSKPPHRNVYTVPLPFGQARLELPATINFPTIPASTQIFQRGPIVITKYSQSSRDNVSE